MYLDVDDLKQINDKFGHAAGDAALVAFAALLTTNYRESDIIARMSGDEFIVIPVGDGRCCHEIIASRLMEALQRLNALSTLSCPLVVSFGIAMFDPNAPTSVEDLITNAGRCISRKGGKAFRSDLPFGRRPMSVKAHVSGLPAFQ